MIKNSVPLKEVLTRRGAGVRRGLIGGTTMLARNDVSSPRKCDTADCQLARSDCAAGVFVTRTFGDRHAADVMLLIEAGRKHVAWTLSLGFWQEKNFSCAPALRLFVLAKTGLSRESPPPIRPLAVFASRDAPPLMVNDQCTRACARSEVAAMTPTSRHATFRGRAWT
jgi:hypothetical protein